MFIPATKQPRLDRLWPSFWKVPLPCWISNESIRAFTRSARNIFRFFCSVLLYSNPEAILSPQKRDVLFKHCFGIQEGGGDSKLTCLGFKFYPIGMRNSERQV